MIYKSPLLDLLEKRFDLSLDELDDEHLSRIHEHYSEKKRMCLEKYGENALRREEYAKAYIISEAARMMMLREIMPRPKTKKKRQG